MNQQNEHLNNLSEIRSLMESSTRFLSLSGLAGVIAGILALCGALAAYLFLNVGVFSSNYYTRISDGSSYNTNVVGFFIADALIVLVLALIFGLFFTARNARKNGHTIWNKAVKKFLIHLFVPLIAGGMFCIALMFQHAVYMVAPAMLVFYGLALVSASVFTFRLVKYLGFCEIILGLIACFFIGYGLIFWAIGFGVLHIIYGIVMYYKYEK